MAEEMVKVDVEVWVLVDSCGDYATGITAEDARDEYETDIQSLADSDGFRMFRIALTVPLPELVELSADVPCDGTAPKVTVATVLEK